MTPIELRQARPGLTQRQTILEEEEEGFETLRRKIKKWGKENYAAFPWRSTKNKWHALVAEIMLQRTRAEQVTPVFLSFTRNFKTPSAFLKRTRSNAFKGLGLLWRHRHLVAMAKELTELGSIPTNKVGLLSLPGVGPYASAAFRSMHANLRDVIIDSNVVRLYGRVFGLKTHSETRREEWFIQFAGRLTPKRQFRAYNYALIDFTRAICRPKPLCHLCPLTDICTYFSDRTKADYSGSHATVSKPRLRVI